MTVEERFWIKVDVRGLNECWPWLAYTRQGYGGFKLDGRSEQAHRVAWILTHGPIPEATPFVLHHCDNPPCCNPFRCLWLGTQADNVIDMDRKDRRGHNNTPGPERPNWNGALRARVLSLHSQGMTGVAIAAEVGRSPMRVSQIIHG